MLKKHILVMLIFIGVIFFVPEVVEAKTTLSVCTDGCDYSNFEDIYMDYRNNTLTDKDLTIEVGEGEYYDADYLKKISYFYDVSLTIKGASRENTKLYKLGFNNEMVNFNIENLSIIDDNVSFYTSTMNSISLKKVNIDFISQNEIGSPDISLYVSNSVNIEDVLINNYLTEADETILYIYNYDLAYGSGTNNLTVNIDNLTINNNGGKREYGLVLDSVKEANINNLTVNNTEVGLYVHRNTYFDADSSVIVNNSNLLNTTCSSFNILDDVGILHPIPGAFINNKNYQLIFQDNNSLNCAVASGNDTNTYISSNNIIASPLTSYTYDEIDYDNLTNSLQNVNNGTVDLVKKYKGTITIEQGSSSPIEDAFDDITISNDVKWTSKDESISIIDINDILGLKEGNTIITGISDDGLIEYEIGVTVIKNPVTNSMIYVGIGLLLILVLGTALYTVYKIKIIVNRD